MTTTSARRLVLRCGRPAVARRYDSTASASCCSALCLAMRTSGRSAHWGSILHEFASELPVEGMRLVPVPVGDEPIDPLNERCLGCEVSPTENAALKDPKPDLDLVDPRGVLGGVDE